MMNQKTNGLIVAPAYDKLLFHACCELLMRNGLRVNEPMYALLNCFSDGSVETWHTMVEPAVVGIADWLKTFRQQYGGGHLAYVLCIMYVKRIIVFHSACM